MTRPVRIEYEGALYHVISRGSEQAPIFHDKRDYQKFLHHLDLIHQRYGVLIHSFVLMGNHYHVLLETPNAQLSRAMRDLNGHYTLYFNKRHRRKGHLFEGRYKAILVENETYFLELSRYIHVNPVLAKLADLPEHYDYSSISYFVDSGPLPKWMVTSTILGQFTGSKDSQRKEWLRFLHDRLDDSENPLEKAYAGAILGSERFVNETRTRLVETDAISEDTSAAQQLSNYRDADKDLDKLMRAIRTHFRIRNTSLGKKNSRNNVARNMFVYLARTCTNASLRDVSRHLGDSLSAAAVSTIHSRTKTAMKKPEFRETVETLMKEIGVR